MTTRDYDLDANFFAYYFPLLFTLSLPLSVTRLTLGRCLTFPFLTLPQNYGITCVAHPCDTL